MLLKYTTPCNAIILLYNNDSVDVAYSNAFIPYPRYISQILGFNYNDFVSLVMKVTAALLLFQILSNQNLVSTCYSQENSILYAFIACKKVYQMFI